MLKIDSIVIGWLDTNIRSVMTAGLLSRFHSVLITSIDSTWEISTSVIGHRITSLDPGCSFLGAGVIVPGKDLSGIASKLNLFNGFDEVWCFEREPTSGGPENVSLVAPRNLERDTPPPGLVSWMIDNSCKLGLGDGVGMNFATSDEEIARSLEHFGQLLR